MAGLLNSMRIFIGGAWLGYIALFHWSTPLAYVVSKVLMPISQLLFFTYLGTTATGPESAPFYIVGNALQVASINGVYGMTMTIGRERREGTLIYLIGSPANRFVIFLGRTLFNIIDGMISVVLSFVWGVLLLHLDLGTANLIGLALAILITTASTCGLGLLIGSLSLITLNVTFVNNTVYYLLLLFSGANIALDKLPLWMQIISYNIPLTRGIQAARMFVAGASFAETRLLLIGEAAVGLIYAFLGFMLFNWFERQARLRGTLESF